MLFDIYMYRGNDLSPHRHSLQFDLELFVFTYVHQDNVKVETPCCALAHPNDPERKYLFMT